jgi:hypothetical protein
MSTAGMRESGMVPVACRPVQRARVSEEHEIHAVTAYEVGLMELLPIRGSACEWNERSEK